MTTVGKIYRLPEALGGAEVKRLLAGPVELGNGILVEVEGVGLIVLTPDLLVEVPPPIPDEPARWGAYLIDGHHAVQRPDGMWERPGVLGCYTSWEELLNQVADEPAEAKIVPLVPAPALPTVDPEAPWSHTDGDGDRIVIRMVGGATGAILTTDSNGTVILDTHEARVGAALYILAIDKAIEAGS